MILLLKLVEELQNKLRDEINKTSFVFCGYKHLLSWKLKGLLEKI